MDDLSDEQFDIADGSLDSTENGPSSDLDSALDSETRNLEAVLDTLALISRERDEAQDRALRALADLQNVRRRSQEQIDQTRKLATEHLVLQLLPVLDNFERTLAALEGGASVESISEGVAGIEKQLRTVLNSVSLSRIETKGTVFDPEVHEAIGIDEDSGVASNTVTLEIEPGYKMAGKVIRPAKVRVSK